MEKGHTCESCKSGCGTSSKKGHGCGCGHKKLKTMTIIENNKEVLCNVLDIFDYEDKVYIALQNKDTDRIYLYQYIEKGDDIILLEIEETEVLRAVGRVLMDIIED